MDTIDPNETPEARAMRHASEAQDHEQRKQAAIQQREEARLAAAEVEAIDTRTSTHRESMICIDCRESFMATVLTIGRSRIAQRICQPCQLKREHEASEKERKAKEYRLREAWLDICPEDYAETDVNRLTEQKHSEGFVAIMDGVERSMDAAANLIIAWPLDKLLGLGLFGSSGIGKTRLMFKLLERMHFAGQKVAYVNAATMSDRYGALLGESAAAGNEYLRRLESVPNLFIDDLGKAKMTERGEQGLYSIVEARRSHQKRTFFTANCTMPELIQRLSPDRAQPIVRRLRDMTVAISFTKA